jgi:hypothetical protein
LPEVLGNLQLGFIPYNENAVLPEPPIDVTLIIEPLAGGSTVRHKITDPAGGFALSLSPGEYKILMLEVEAPAMSPDPIDLPTGSPKFTVPDKGCMYVGRIFIFYFRLPAGSVNEQAALVQEIAEQADRPTIFFIYLESGGLVPKSAGVDLPDESERIQGAANCTIQLAEFETP